MVKKRKFKKYKEYREDELGYPKSKSARKKHNYSIWLLLVLIILAFISLLFTDFITFRHVSEKQLDDVSPKIACDNDLFNKSDVLMIIPYFNNVPISQNMNWCRQILALNKTLGMHGVYHTYNEFLELRNQSYIQKGMDEFKRCFGFYPTIFEAPQLALSKENANLLKTMGLKVEGYSYSFWHKVYHCSDTGQYSNSFIDMF
jgi:hypothetical protein